MQGKQWVNDLMQPDMKPSTATPRIEIQLLDPASGRPVKSWSFQNQLQITIGRLADQDVEIVDPYVSRTHAQLIFQQGTWYLISLGRHGVLLANRQITQQAIPDEAIFRLGSEGPSLKFRAAAEPTANQNTITFDALPTLPLNIDRGKVEHEVQAISSESFFQSLQQKAKEMRSRLQR
jgi:pSer/pThr/pTyr-binding forkhead associated (FHA) protein